MTGVKNRKGVVLVADDSHTARLLLGRLLEKENDVVLAENGRQCLEMAASVRPDLIVLDVLMPEMDGYETCSRLKADPATRDIPVIFVTASTDEQDETWGLEIGAVDYIHKPFRAAVVLARVRNQIELKRYREHLEAITFRDELTGIANTSKFDEHLEKEWKRAARYRRELSVIYVDVDNFTAFNAVYGHTHGDETLSRVAATLARAVRRSSDLVARIQGARFGIILPETGADGARAVCETLLQAVAALEIPHQESGAAPYVSVSLASATRTPGRDESLEALLDDAEKKLQKAKELGRNRFVC